MKKLKAFLTLLGFIMASQIQVIHAMDMGVMYVDQNINMVHLIQNNESIFCNVGPTKQNSNDCAKEIIQDKGFSTQNNSEIKKNDKKITYSNLIENQIIWVNKISISINSHAPPGSISVKSIYSNLTGIIKNLN